MTLPVSEVHMLFLTARFLEFITYNEVTGYLSWVRISVLSQQISKHKQLSIIMFINAYIIIWGTFPINTGSVV